jgi:hypothetical protein
MSKEKIIFIAKKTIFFVKYCMRVILFILFLLPNCLTAKKSAFNLSGSPGFALFGIFLFLSETFEISGTVQGLDSGNLTIQINNSDDLTLVTGTRNYKFSKKFSRNSSYTINTKSHPPGYVCTLGNGFSGTISRNITVDITCATLTTSNYFSTSSNWMDYVKRDGLNATDATGVQCTGSETGHYNSCIHAGEMKSIVVPNLTSCDGISASDSLSAFNWKCVAGTSSLKIISTGLREDKHLTDLIDFTNVAWKDNQITVTKNSTIFMTTQSSKWWTNPISVRNGGMALGVAVSGSIYVIQGGSTSISYSIDKSKVGLVIQPNTTLINNTINPSITISSSLSFLWIEGRYNNNNGMNVNAIDVSSGSKFLVLRNLFIRGASSGGFGTTGIQMNSSVNQSALLHSVRIAQVYTCANLNSNGVMIRYMNASYCNNLQLAQNDFITDTIVTSGTAANGIDIATSAYSSNLLFNTTVTNTNNSNISINTMTNITFMNTLTSNTGMGTYSGIIIGAFVISPKFINTAMAHQSGPNSYVENLLTSNNSKFNGILKIGLGCSINGTNSGLSAFCVRQNGSETTPATVTGISLANSFVGKVTTDDTSNPIDTNGFSSSAPANVFDLQNQFRAWGLDGIAFPNITNAGQCSTNCRIWDWSLKSSDNVVRNVNACPSGTIVDTHTWSGSAANQTYCDNNYLGSKLSGSTCVTTFLRNAVEIFADGVGNDNGICESNEDCMYTPNIGAYQGHSKDATSLFKLIPASQTSSTTNVCQDIGTGGTITNVKLYKFETNGY